MNELVDYLKEAWEHRADSYWHADHPEIRAVLIAILTGLIGLAFAWIQQHLLQRYQLPETNDV